LYGLLLKKLGEPQKPRTIKAAKAPARPAPWKEETSASSGERPPEENMAAAPASRAQTREPEEDRDRRSSKLPLHDGTANTISLREWIRKVEAQQEEWDDENREAKWQVRRVLESLSGTPYEVVTDGGDRSSVLYRHTDGTYEIRRDVGQILEKLKERDTTFVSRSEAAAKLDWLRQGNKTVAEFSAEFDVLAAQAGILPAVKSTLFFAKLSASIKKQFGGAYIADGQEYATIWKQAMAAEGVAKRENSRSENGRSRGRGRGGKGNTKGRGTQADKDKRDVECYNCGKKGHYKSECRSKAQEGSGSTRGRGRGGASGGNARRITQGKSEDHGYAETIASGDEEED